jgi:ferredoxin-like protein FixX
VLSKTLIASAMLNTAVIIATCVAAACNDSDICVSKTACIDCVTAALIASASATGSVRVPMFVTVPFIC